MLDFDDEPRLNRGNIPTEGIERTALDQTVYYTNASGKSVACTPYGDHVDYGEAKFVGASDLRGDNLSGNFRNQSPHFRRVALPSRDRTKPVIDKLGPGSKQRAWHTCNIRSSWYQPLNRLSKSVEIASSRKGASFPDHPCFFHATRISRHILTQRFMIGSRRPGRSDSRKIAYR